MADPYTRPYLDANVYITAIKGPTSEDPGKVDLAANILRLAEEGRFQIFASTFLVAEVIKTPGDPSPLTPQQEATISRYFQRESIVLLELDILIAEKAREIAPEHG